MTATTEATLAAKAKADGIEKIVIGAVVTDELGRVLLLQRDPHEFMSELWELPSGEVEAGETWAAALQRELAEEAGIPVPASLGDFVGSFDYRSHSGRETRQFNFAVQAAGMPPVHLSPEHQAHVWVGSAAQIPGNTSAEVAALVTAFLKSKAA